MKTLVLFAWLFVAASLAGGPGEGVMETLSSPVLMSETPAHPRPDVATADARTDALSHRLRCPVCQGLSVADSTSEAALTMKARVRELVEQGYSEEQITRYFVTRYGQWIELEPPAEGLNWIIFLGPVVLVAVGLGVVWTRVRGQPAVAVAAPAVDEAWRAKVLEELGERPGRNAGEKP